MARVKRGVTQHARHKKIIKRARGARGRASNVWRVATQRVDKNLEYAYRDRRTRKRQMRGLWIQRINAGARLNGLTYSQLMNGLNKAGVEVDRKVLSDIAAREPESFAAIVAQAKSALEKAAA